MQNLSNNNWLADDLCESMWPTPLGMETFICLLLVLLAILFLASVTMNVCLLVVFFRKRSLRTTSNRFVMNLLVVNLASSLLLLPLVALDLSGASLYQEQCLVSQAVSQAVASLSLLSTLLVGIDQYLAVIRPLRYHHHMTRTTATTLLVGVWVVSSFAATSFFLLPSPSSTSPLWHSCPDPLPLEPVSVPFFFSLFLLIATFLLPTITLAAIYCRIYSEAHTSSERTRKNSLAPGSGEGIFNIANTAVVPLGGPSLGSPSLRSSFSRSFRHRVSNASQLMRREEGRTARVYIASLSLILLCWAPTYLYSSLPFLLPPLPTWANPLLLILSLLYSLISPFIFAFRHRKIRGEVSRLFSFQPSHPPLPPFARVQRSASREQKNKMRHSLVVDKGGKTSNLLECDLLINSSSSGTSFSSSSSLLAHKLEEAPAGPFGSDC